MKDFIPAQPANSFRIILELHVRENRLDNILLNAIKQQDRNIKLKEISRVKYKELFKTGKIFIKGQKANPASAVAAGTTYIDILGQ
jgi:hypothetical protein